MQFPTETPELSPEKMQAAVAALIKAARVTVEAMNLVAERLFEDDPKAASKMVDAAVRLHTALNEVISRRSITAALAGEDPKEKK